jgi:hypothetical protein
LWPLGLTLAVELPVAALLGLRSRRALSVVALVNLITNPLLTYLLAAAARAGSWAVYPASGSVVLFVVGEVTVVFAEWRLLLWALGGARSRMLGISLAMNAASALAGILVWWL